MFNAGVGAVLNVVLNLLLIPKMSLVGAAIATVATEFYFFIAASYFISKAQYNINFSKLIPKPLFATFIMGLFIHYFIRTPLPILILLSALIYFIILYLTNYLSDDDMRLVKQALARKSVEG
jgi:O-antigen/teichoic acid export membrane protein